jgi:hypothetical protein
MRLTSTGQSTYLLERHIEMLQSTKTVVDDAYDVTFDQLAKSLTVAKVCNQDGGPVSDAGATWATVVFVGGDGGPTGSVRIEQPDIPVALTYADGGTGEFYGVFTKQ